MDDRADLPQPGPAGPPPSSPTVPSPASAWPPEHVVWPTPPPPAGDGEGSDHLAVRGSRVERFARSRRPWYARAFVVIAAVTALGGGLRFWHLSSPHTYVFDEVYYAKDGCYDAGYAWSACHLPGPGEQTVTVHPPLGREIIAVSERLFGNRPFGWRFASAVFGTLSVLLISILALKLWGSVVWAGVAGLLLATENLNLVQSRISMLDIFVTTFVLAGFLSLFLDRRWIERRTPEPPEPTEYDPLLTDMPEERPPSPIFRPWRLAAGLAFGAAGATKWSGALALVAGVVLAVAWERTRRRDWGMTYPFLEAVRDEGFGLFVFLLLLPIAVYVGSYARWWATNGLHLHAWVQLQIDMAKFSLGLRATHPYASPAWKWILMIRPVAYYYQCPVKNGDACVKAAEILGMGSPFIFWTSVLTVPYAFVSWIRKRDWRGGLVTVAFAVQYLPWFLAKRTSFLFYMAPVTPFMVLALVYATRDLSAVRVGFERSRTLSPLAALIVLASVGMFAYFWPILVGQTVSWSAWHQRMWLPSWV